MLKAHHEDNAMLSIGELSKTVQLTVKTIRLYQEKGLLEPTVVDDQTGYRYYDHSAVERARSIKVLRALDFSLADIAVLLEEASSGSNLAALLQTQRDKIDGKLKKFQGIQQSLDLILKQERELTMNKDEQTFKVEEKNVDDILIVGIRGKGVYEDSGERFSKLGRLAGRHMKGAPLNLFYDAEYKAEDADFESCFVVKKKVEHDDVECRVLPGGRCLSLIHKGAYDTVGRSYAALFQAIREQGLEPQLPSREVYVKGPGMIFKGNPAKYLTEIQVLVR
ncbi:MAG: MerR family transcriptional regulator [Deltaproteobacteria bacterium]|nr:MerR family transcriptional regulator [Deltaproteobacteria bacterium]